MFKNVVFAVVCSLTLLLGGCEEEGSVPVEAVWQPLACDVEEVTTWTVTDASDPVRIREITTTRTESVAVLDVDPATVRVRVLREQHNPCASTPDNCVVGRDTRLSPEQKYVYFSAGTDVVTGLDSGETRVVCSSTAQSTIGVYAPGQPSVTTSVDEPTQVWARGGEFLIH